MKVITFGEVMMRLQTPGNQRFAQVQSLQVTYGGGEANVSASLAQMGQQAAHVTAFPNNDLGKTASSFLGNLKVDTQFIQYVGDRLGLYFVENGAGVRSSKIVYDRANSSFAQVAKDQFDWDKIFENAGWFHFTGITPAISLGAYEACLEGAKIAKSKGLIVSADIGYRSNLWKWGKKPAEIMPSLVQYCDHVVCSAYDAKDMFGINADSFENTVPSLLKQFPQLQSVITTQRGQISASHNTLKGLAFANNTFVETTAMDIPNIVDRIGGGDAFMAGYIYGVINQFDTQKALNFAVAASVLKHTIEGDINLAKAEEVMDIMNGDTGGRIKR